MKKYLILISLVLFFATLLYLPFSASFKFNTPDETANFFFAKIFAQNNSLKFMEPLNSIVDNAMHPRGLNIIAGYLVPESFLGLPVIYGLLGRLFGLKALPYLAPLLICLIFPFYYWLTKKFFGKTVALLSLFLLMVNPVFWYNAGRTFYHNGLFLLFLILFLFFALFLNGEEKNTARAWWYFSLSGIFLGGALFVRPAEVLWVGFLAALLFFYNLWKKNWTALALLAALLPVGAMLFLNHDLYGGYLRFGYATTEAVTESSSVIVPQLSRLGIFQQLIFPFGLHPLSVLRRFAGYGVTPLWWHVILIFLGGIACLPKLINFFGRKKEKDAALWSVYLIVLSLVAFYLIMYYGGFTAEFFTDPGQEVQYEIGSAYLRYWLPIYVLAGPLAAAGLLFLRDRLRCVAYQRVFIGGFIVLAVFLSGRAVFLLPPEGFSTISQSLRDFSAVAAQTEQKTSPEAVFLVPAWADRIYFPERRVVVDVEGKNVIKIVKDLLNTGRDVFYLSGRGAIPLKLQDLEENRLKLQRRFDLDAKGKTYQIVYK